MQRYLSVLFFSGLASATCFAPTMPGIDGCSECAASEMQGMQCVRSGRWFPCSTDMETCCKYGEVSNRVSLETCLGKSGASDPSICDKVVSKVATLNNDYCATECKKLVAAGGDVKTDSAYNERCMYQHYESVNGRTKVDDTCFEKWVYGYSEPNGISSYKQGLTTSTPAQCQLLCQQDPDCINWLWAADLYNDAGGQDVKQRCDLKNAEMVSKAASIKFTDIHPPGLDSQFCNVGMPYQCLKGGFRCLPCGSDDIPSCIWESDMHVSGWKHCVPTPLCGQAATTMAPPTTTPTTTTTTTPTTTTTTTTTTGSTTTTTMPTTTTTTTMSTTTTTTTPKTTTTTTSATTPAVSTTPSTVAPTTTTPTPRPTTTASTAAPTPVQTTPTLTTPAPTTPAAKSSPSIPTAPPSPTQASETEQTEIELSTTNEVDESSTAEDEESTSAGADECDKATATSDGECTKKVHPCGSPCNCRGRRCSPCCRQHVGVEIHVMDRPKHLAFELDN